MSRLQQLGLHFDFEVVHIGGLLFHSRMPRTTQTQLLHMKKKKILERYIGKELTREAAASLLGIHPNALSRLKKRYQEYGESALLGRKPGPRRGTPDNKTPEHIENIVLNIAQDLSLGPLSIAEKLLMSREYN